MNQNQSADQVESACFFTFLDKSSNLDFYVFMHKISKMIIFKKLKLNLDKQINWLIGKLELFPTLHIFCIISHKMIIYKKKEF